MIFQEIGGEWLAVDSAECKSPTLTDKLINTKHVEAKSDTILHKARNNKILAWITRYNILRDGKHVECNIKGWRTALAHARKWQTDLFYNVRRVEILNIWTGEIIDLAEAERRAAAYAQRPKGAVITSTT